jgi:hypothetical protein
MNNNNKTKKSGHGLLAHLVQHERQDEGQKQIHVESDAALAVVREHFNSHDSNQKHVRDDVEKVPAVDVRL